MNINYLVGFQIASDVIICIGILFLLIRLRRFLKPSLTEISEKTIEEFRRLLAESKDSANKFLEELEKEKNNLKHLAESIDEREKRLKDLIKQISSHDDLSKPEEVQKTESDESFSEGPYKEILNLARKGLNEGQISQQLGLPEGEIGLILNLSRAKSK